MTQKITIAFGDGIGPEIMDSTLAILKEAEAKLYFDIIEVGQKIYEKGFSSGLTPSACQTISNNKILLKAPITTPQGGGYKSLNVTMRKRLGLFANVRPVSSFSPFVATKFPLMDVVIIRENEEDLYAGIEYRQTLESYQTLKLVTRQGCEKIIRYAFEYALANNRKKITCFSKDNIMKMTDGLFHKVFDEIAIEYPQIICDHMIIDIGTAKLASKPEDFDVIVTMNLYGDIISDVVAEISGSVGLAGSANIGKEFAMFEAIHGSAPMIANQDIANPTGLISASIMMLIHLNQYEVASTIRNALYKTIEEGVHTADIFNQVSSAKKVGTKEFTKEVISRLGEIPKILPVANFSSNVNKKTIIQENVTTIKSDIVKEEKKLIGFDVFIDWQESFQSLINKINEMESETFEIKTISAKGLILWPVSDQDFSNNYQSGLTALRFIGKEITGKSSSQIIDNSRKIINANLIEILKMLDQKNIDFVKYEGLYLFNNQPAYSSGQGE